MLDLTAARRTKARTSIDAVQEEEAEATGKGTTGKWFLYNRQNSDTEGLTDLTAARRTNTRTAKDADQEEGEVVVTEKCAAGE